jgi:hypothetical protein
MPRAIGLSVALILCIPLLSANIAYAASSAPARTVKQHSRAQNPPKSTVNKTSNITGNKIIKTFPETFFPTPEKETSVWGPSAQSTRSSTEALKRGALESRNEQPYSPGELQDLNKPKPPTFPEIMRIHRESSPKPISKEVSREFEHLGIDNIREDKDTQLSPASILAIQRILNDRTGSKLTDDGQLGPKTREAIRQFQSSRGLSKTGTIDTNTARQLIAEAVIPGTTMFHIAVSPETGKCQIMRSCDDQTKIRENQRDMIPVESIDDLMAYIGKGPSTVYPAPAATSSRFLFISGANIPVEWKSRLESEDFRTVRISAQSPKIFLKDHQSAARLANKTISSDTEILSALPRANSESDMMMKLKAMNLPVVEMPRWLRNSRKIDDVERAYAVQFPGKQKYFEEVSKQKLIDVLSGDKDVIFLIAHLDKGDIVLPSGEKILTREIDGLKRDPTDSPKQRVIVVIGCGAGAVNQEAEFKALGQRLIDNNLADLVIAHPEYVSAEKIPEQFQELLSGKKRFIDTFSPDRKFEVITQFHPHDRDLSCAMYTGSCPVGSYHGARNSTYGKLEQHMSPEAAMNGLLARI